MFIGGKLLLCFLVLHSLQSAVVGQGDSECDCPNPHPQSMYCSSNLVFQGKLKKIMPNNTFTVQIKRMFKGNTDGIKLKIDLINVLSDSDCYKDIAINKKYLFFAKNTQDGMMVLEKCSAHRWGKTKKNLRLGLANLFAGAGCDCWKDRTEEYNKCRWKHAYLKKNGDKCEWTTYKIKKTCPQS